MKTIASKRIIIIPPSRCARLMSGSVTLSPHVFVGTLAYTPLPKLLRQFKTLMHHLPQKHLVHLYAASASGNSPCTSDGPSTLPLPPASSRPRASWCPGRNRI